MADIVPLNIPKPPDSPDLNEMHKHAHDMYLFFQTHLSKGTQAPFFSQNQLNLMSSDKSQAGKIFMNNDTGKLNVAEIISGNLVIKEVVTS